MQNASIALSTVEAERASSTIVDSSRHPRWSRLDPFVREEIDTFETELRRMQAGLTADKVFLEFRLRHGVYGQRQEGVQMQRIKIPMGRVTARSMEVLAEVGEEYAVGVLHVTTRQDIQIHYVDINDTPNMMRRLAEVGITTKEACGNAVRNVCACPQAGCCQSESFDVTPYADACTQFLLRHPDTQNFGRKFKISFSGCAGEACGLALMHDIGAVAVVREVEGTSERGFALYVGGGLGAVPHRAKLFDEFVPMGEFLPLAQAMARVFARLGEKRNRARARLKFLVAKLGLDEFRRQVLEEREKLPFDPRWTDFIDEADAPGETALRPASELALDEQSGAFKVWYRHNVAPQRQPGYAMATVFLPLGDLTATQMRGLAALCRRFVNDTVRLSAEQNILVRWLPKGDLPAFFEGLRVLNLHLPGAGKLRDVVACPGTDSCKLGITSSRGLAAKLFAKSSNGMSDLGLRDDLRVKISGCFNSCGTHHIADIGFFGSVKRVGNHKVPMFQVVLGGTNRANADAFGLTVARVPTQRAPEVVRVLADDYTAKRLEGESFREYVDRLGRKYMKDLLDPYAEVDLAAHPELLRDNRQTWDYDMQTGVGECAGEVVDQAEFMLGDADRLYFESLLKLEAGQLEEAARIALQAMLKAADGLLSTRGLLLSDHYDTVAEFRRHYAENGFWRPIQEYFYRAAGEEAAALDAEQVHQRVEEARLFIVESEQVYSRDGSSGAAAAAN